MFSLLRQPYPIPERTPAQIFLTGLLAGAFVALFLIIFQPFGTNEVEFEGKTLFLSGYGLIVSVVIWLANFLPARLADEARWTVGKQVLLMLATILLGITISYFYVMLLGGTFGWHGYSIFLVNAMSVAVFPILGLTLADYVIKLRRYGGGAKIFNERTPAAAVTSATLPPLVVKDEQDRPVVTLPVSRIWCLRSDRNYVDIFHLDEEGTATKTTVRNTLTKLGEELPANFLRCHRSFVVNAPGVDRVSGNAQGYRLHHPDFEDMAVPVSRGRSAEILGFIRG